MTKDDIIRMARKSGFAHGICWAAHEKDLLMFANLVAAAEREACAKVCEARNSAYCAFSIRERSAP
jgi:hypothetical protein